ncbi:sigma-70 family RNA polymerase sigma factor [Pusillimonas sp. SM2304]|uniref:sigma-70 family RNA polymerase sigma factor n=1 Tax=Pusillimonas sp. SM2304 TaxID=3073241 RepID=UPI002875A49B|nr:sigma-70 family RNA polymerase sigma factor [Pusillimonas sp. SM2304]MDS1140424.1 sigma-70 family RNA polymerase sigma factor [Pusillimonas sp. SM2304]
MPTTASSSPQEIESFYSNHHGWLRGWLHRKLGNAFDAADLAHDTYVRILAAGNPPDAGQSRRHLTQVANGLLIDLYRRRRIEAAYLHTLSLLPEPEAPSEEDRALVLEALIEIDTMLHRLPDKARRALLLCKIDGLSYRDIAKQLNVSVSSVEKYIARSLQACYETLYSNG